MLTGGVWSRRKALLALEPPGASLSPCPAGPTQLHLERRWGNSGASLPVRGSVLPRSLYIIIIAFAIDQHCVVTGQSNQSNLNLVQQYSSLPSIIDYMRQERGIYFFLIVSSASPLMLGSSGRGDVWQTKVGMPTSTSWVVDTQKWCGWWCTHSSKAPYILEMAIDLSQKRAQLHEVH